MDHLEIAVPSWASVFEQFPGVPIFFVISGYLVSASFERSGNVAAYFQNRFLRIYPGLWMCIILTVLVASSFGYNFIHLSALTWLPAQMAGLIYTPSFLADFGFGSYNGSLWTIPIELQFYCVLPLVYLLVRQKSSSNHIFFVLLGAFVAIALLAGLYAPNMGLAAETHSEKIFRYTFVPHFYMFLAGLVLQRTQAYRSRLIFGKGFYWIAAYLLFCYLVPESAWSLVASRLVLAVCTVSLAYTLPGIAENILKGNDISYGVYIYHGLILNIMVSLHLLHSTGFLAAVAAGSYLAGYLSWVLVERRFLRSKRQKLMMLGEPASEPSAASDPALGGGSISAPPLGAQLAGRAAAAAVAPIVPDGALTEIAAVGLLPDEIDEHPSADGLGKPPGGGLV
jgi:peptidoglycan/LPS O-acetylase OafA/YrhL